MNFKQFIITCIIVTTSIAPLCDAAELFVLTPETIEETAPAGRGAGAILGDYALRNDRLVAIVGNPRSITVGAGAAIGDTATGGRLLDLSRRGKTNDLMHLFQIVTPLRLADPAKRNEPFDALRARLPTEREPIGGQRVTLAFPTTEPFGEVRYILEDGWPYVLVELYVVNSTDQPMTLDTTASLTMAIATGRTERRLHTGSMEKPSLAWVYDPWYGQAYGVMAEDSHVNLILVGRTATRVTSSTTQPSDVTIEPGDSATIRRLLIPGAHVFDVASAARDVAMIKQHRVRVRVRDKQGNISEADVAVIAGGAAPAVTMMGASTEPASMPSGEREVNAPLMGLGRTGSDGWIEMALEPGRYELRVQAPARAPQSAWLDVNGAAELTVECERAGYAEIAVVDERRRPIGCRIEFKGIEGTATPFFFPDGGEDRSRNAIRTPNGQLRQPLAPGRYEVTARAGAGRAEASERITVTRGKDAVLKLMLRPSEAVSQPAPAPAGASKRAGAGGR